MAAALLVTTATIELLALHPSSVFRFEIQMWGEFVLGRALLDHFGRFCEKNQYVCLREISSFDLTEFMCRSNLGDVG